MTDEPFSRRMLQPPAPPPYEPVDPDPVETEMLDVSKTPSPTERPE